jgi:hypothetical protein
MDTWNSCGISPKSISAITNFITITYTDGDVTEFYDLDFNGSKFSDCSQEDDIRGRKEMMIS